MRAERIARGGHGMAAMVREALRLDCSLEETYDLVRRYRSSVPFRNAVQRFAREMERQRSFARDLPDIVLLARERVRLRNLSMADLRQQPPWLQQIAEDT